jgi:NAD(P)-dependent dehydrogenase (short-subunit alcohol dehydrogenase family)
MADVLGLFRLDGRHAVVAGGAGLLGPSFAEALLEAGATVTVLDVDKARLDVVDADLGRRFAGRFAAVRASVTNEAEVEDAVAALDARAPIDVVVNAAAVNPQTDGSAGGAAAATAGFTDYPLGAWRASLDVNLTGTFLVSRAVCRRFETRGRGVVVNVSSTYGLVGPDQRLYTEGQTPPHFVKPGDYSATKAGIIGFTRYLAAYYAGTTIRVNCLAPGGVENEHNAAFVRAYASRTILKRMARRDEYKGALLFLCSEASSYMTGAVLVVDGGWTAI